MYARPLALLTALTLFSGSVIATAPGERPKTIEFYGVVRNAEGHSVKDCPVTLTAPGDNRYARFVAREVIASRVALLTTVTNAEGAFKFTVDVTDRKWNGAGEGLLIAQLATGEIALQSYRLSRGLVDLPLELLLGPATKTSVCVVDKSGRPLAGVRVAPGRYGKNRLPLSAAEKLEVVSNDEGVVELPSTNQPLTAVFALGSNLGNQFLRAQPDTGDKFKAVALASTPRKLHCVPPDGAQPSDIGRIEWSLVSFQKSNDEMELAWQRIITNGVEAVEVALPEGSVSGWSDAKSGHGWMLADHSFELTDQVEAPLKLQRASHVVGQVVAKENGKPLPGISLIETYSEEPTLTQEDGSFEMWLPKLSDGTFPSDPLEEFFSEDAFFRRPLAEHAPGEAKIKPFELTRRTATVGTVLDADGKPVAGMTVKGESKQERFTLNHDFLTDRHGSFRMTNISDGTPLKLQAMDQRGVTESPLEITVSPTSSPVIRLAKPVTKRFEGRIVDADGQSIVGATVEFQLGRVSIAEGYRAAEYEMENPFDNPAFKRSRFVTDANGRFETDELFNWKNVFGLKVSHPQFYETTSWLRRVDKTPVTEEQFNFGELKMHAAPASQKFSVQVTDKAGVAVADAKVLFIQGRDSADHGQTDASGRVSFEGKRVAGIVAARHEQRVAFATFSEDTSSLTLNLDSIPSDQAWKEWPGNLAERKKAASKILKNFEMSRTLDFNAGTEGEMVAVLDAMVFANPAVVVQLATTKRAELEKHPQAGAILIGQAVNRNPALASGLVPFMPAEYQHHLYLQLARKTPGTEASDENLAQALTLTRKLDGDEGATATGTIATLLLERGDLDLATELISAVYENQRKDFETATEQRGKRGVARYYFPQLALVDFNAACQLIHKHAYPTEIDMLQTLALSLAVATNKTDWRSGLKKLGRTTLGDHEAAMALGTFETPLPNEPFVESLLAEVRSEKNKAMICVRAAIRLPNVEDSVRKKWLNRGVEYLAQAKQEFPSFYTETLAYKFREHFSRLGKLDPMATRQLAFFCLEEMSEFRDGQYFYLPDRAGYMAEVLGGVDTKLSRTLLQPFLDDFSWHYRNGFRFAPSPLASAARIDPEWACTIAQQLIEGELRDDKSRQAYVLTSILDGLAIPQ